MLTESLLSTPPHPFCCLVRREGMKQRGAWLTCVPEECLTDNLPRWGSVPACLPRTNVCLEHRASFACWTPRAAPCLCHFLNCHPRVTFYSATTESRLAVCRQAKGCKTNVQTTVCIDAYSNFRCQRADPLPPHCAASALHGNHVHRPHHRLHRLADVPMTRRPRWMHAFQGLSVFDLYLPGTHDSAAYT